MIQTPTNAQVVEDMASKAAKVLAPLAAKLGTTATYVLHVLIIKQLADGIVLIVAWGLVAAFIFALGRHIIKYGEGEDDDFDSSFYNGLGWACYGLSTAVFAATIGCNLSQVIYPQGAALEYILNLIKGQ